MNEQQNTNQEASQSADFQQKPPTPEGRSKKIILILGALVLVFFVIGTLASLRNKHVDENSFESNQVLLNNTDPMYGFSSYDDYRLRRDVQQAKIDDTFVKGVLADNPDTAEQSNYAVFKGFEFLQNGDSETAIKRFNQGWLIDNNNQNVYWGFAIYTGTKKGNELALKYFDTALEKFDQKYINEVTDKDRLTCDAAIGYASAYVDGGQTNNLYITKAKELTSVINIQNATPQCANLIRDLKAGNL